MIKNKFKNTLVMAAGMALTGIAVSPAMAKLAAPTPEAKAKADETSAKAAWSARMDGYKLCQAQDQVAAKYRASAAAAGKPVPTPSATPPCSDPGPFAYAAPGEAKPIEAAGAHSPATTAASPPNTNQPSSEAHPATKK
ncbi:hypothetical protein [Variovorax ginsengisoli]|uniref:Uncharacterized protein n=1 Tax=Variovorax ginsengisoli TaxID=363844 RepID=A0ABT9S0L2_9BURK|nr:hypothetical protein [Variovorax ginsengisoli]MDP9897894.1 hypothetical protein [Variovorax ginsengisoli]